jgi:hypothetical protein
LDVCACACACACAISCLAAFTGICTGLVGVVGRSSGTNVALACDVPNDFVGVKGMSGASSFASLRASPPPGAATVARIFMDEEEEPAERVVEGAAVARDGDTALLDGIASHVVVSFLRLLRMANGEDVEEAEDVGGDRDGECWGECRGDWDGDCAGDVDAEVEGREKWFWRETRKERGDIIAAKPFCSPFPPRESQTSVWRERRGKKRRKKKKKKGKKKAARTEQASIWLVLLRKLRVPPTLISGNKPYPLSIRFRCRLHGGT